MKMLLILFFAIFLNASSIEKSDKFFINNKGQIERITENTVLFGSEQIFENEIEAVKYVRGISSDSIFVYGGCSAIFLFLISFLVFRGTEKH